MITVNTECSACKGSGVYVGFAEPKGVGVVCLICAGSGCRKLEYVPFTVRRIRDNVQFVAQSQGSLLVTGVGPVGNKITYNEFMRGKRP